MPAKVAMKEMKDFSLVVGEEDIKKDAKKAAVNA